MLCIDEALHIMATKMEQSISATLYPTRIIVATMIIKPGGSVCHTSDCLSILPVDISDKDLGIVMLRHVLLSEERDVSIDEGWDLRTRYRNLTKFKTEGQLMKDSRLVKATLLDNCIFRYEPRINRYSLGRQRFYQGKKEDIFEIKYPCPDENLGLALRKAWELAIIT